MLYPDTVDIASMTSSSFKSMPVYHRQNTFQGLCYKAVILRYVSQWYKPQGLPAVNGGTTWLHLNVSLLSGRCQRIY